MGTDEALVLRKVREILLVHSDAQIPNIYKFAVCVAHTNYEGDSPITK